MAAETSHRCILAAPNPKQTPMDATTKKHPKPSPSTSAAAAAKRHPLPHPTTTIKSISHHLSKLCPNPLKTPSLPRVLDSSCSTLTKSRSLKAEPMDVGTKPKVSVKLDDTKKPVPKVGPRKRLSTGNSDVKKDSQLMSRSFEEVKRGFGGMRRRRSFCSSQVELADFLSCSGVKVVAVDMPPFMQIHAVDCARMAHDSLESFTSKNLAFTLKKEFDGVYGPAWHCIVGTSFGSFVTHSVGGFIYFSMDHKLYILLFKTTVQRAE